MKRQILLLVLLLVYHSVSAQTAVDKTRSFRQTHEHQILRELLTLLAIPNLASDSENIRKNAEFISEMMRQRGLNPRLLEAKTPRVPPVVFGEWKTPGATR